MPMGFALKQRVLAIDPAFQVPISEFYNSSTNRIWIADYAPLLHNNVIPTFNPTSANPTTIVDLQALWGDGRGAGRLYGDSTYVYANSQNNTSGGFGTVTQNNNQVAIINQATGFVVGLCQVNGTGYVAIDQTTDGAGNLYVIAFYSSSGISNVQKFSIASAISSYPTPATPTATSGNLTYTAITYDTVTSSLFVGSNLSGSFTPSWSISSIGTGSPGTVTTSTPIHFMSGSYMQVNAISTGVLINGSSFWNGQITVTGSNSFTMNGSTVTGSYVSGGTVTPYGNGPYQIATMNPSTLAVTNTLDFTTQSSFPNSFPIYHMIEAFGSIWVTTSNATFDGTAGRVLRINPSTFPASSSVTGVAVNTDITAYLSADTTNSTILVGAGPGSNHNISRISSSTTLQVSHWSVGGGFGPATSAVATPGGIWVTYSPGTINVYSSTIGSETLTNTITEW